MCRCSSVVDLPAGRQGNSNNMYYVYVLKSLKDNKNYTGITNDLDRRIKEHNIGKKSTQSTENRGPFKLIYYELVKGRIEARVRERFLKSGMGREYLKNKLPV